MSRTCLHFTVPETTVGQSEEWFPGMCSEVPVFTKGEKFVFLTIYVAVLNRETGIF